MKYMLNGNTILYIIKLVMLMFSIYRFLDTYLMDNVKSGGKKSDSEKDVYDNQPNPKIG